MIKAERAIAEAVGTIVAVLFPFENRSSLILSNNKYKNILVRSHPSQLGGYSYVIATQRTGS